MANLHIFRSTITHFSEIKDVHNSRCNITMDFYCGNGNFMSNLYFFNVNKYIKKSSQNSFQPSFPVTTPRSAFLSIKFQAVAYHGGGRESRQPAAGGGAARRNDKGPQPGLCRMLAQAAMTGHKQIFGSLGTTPGGGFPRTTTPRIANRIKM